MLILFDVGRRIGNARLASDMKGVAKGGGVVEGAVFALLGLLIALTFTGAASRFEARRSLITEEANAIGAAYLARRPAAGRRTAGDATAISPLSGHAIGDISACGRYGCNKSEYR
jgi:hypothetical protein